jgi:transposase
MERYIGLDVHLASTTFAVVSESGKRLGSQVVETNGRALVAHLKTLPGNKHVCLEEGTQAAWIYEILRPHVVEVVVLAVSESRGPKSDQRDAFGLAERLRAGQAEPRVFKERGEFRALGELSRTHDKLVQDCVRAQNRLKSLYRSRGVSVSGKSVYSLEGRSRCLAKLPAATRGAAELLYAQYDAIAPVRAEAEKKLVHESHRHPITRVLETCPGLGPIRVAHLVSIVVSPFRFRTKRPFWSYCGLGIEMRSSSDWVRAKDGSWNRATVQQTRGLNYNHNHRLKAIFKGAATTVSTQQERHPLRQYYEHLLAGGTKPNLAKLSLARKIAATALAMWKHEEEYDPKKTEAEAL